MIMEMVDKSTRISGMVDREMHLSSSRQDDLKYDSSCVCGHQLDAGVRCDILHFIVNAASWGSATQEKVSKRMIVSNKGKFFLNLSCMSSLHRCCSVSIWHTSRNRDSETTGSTKQGKRTKSWQGHI